MKEALSRFDGGLRTRELSSFPLGIPRTLQEWHIQAGNFGYGLAHGARAERVIDFRTTSSLP
jgi:hypothetical protein